MSALQGVEQQRHELEANVAKLQKALYHWRTWDAEYEGLKEELQKLSETPSSEEIVPKLSTLVLYGKSRLTASGCCTQ